MLLRNITKATELHEEERMSHVVVTKITKTITKTTLSYEKY